MSNILKQYRVAGEDKNVRVINSNSMIKQIFADSISRPADSYTGISSDAQSSLEKTKSLSPDTQESGFNDGINAAVVTEIDVSAEKERLLEEAKLEADSILDKAKAEASRLLDEAKQRAQILYADNKSKGYEDGLAECQREFDEKEISLRQELSDKESALKSKYDAYSKELESDLIDAIIQVFNKVFKIQFDDKKDILFHLVENTMSNIEVGKEFRIHVAYSNYKFMMSHLRSFISSFNATLLTSSISSAFFTFISCVRIADLSEFIFFLQILISDIFKLPESCSLRAAS